MSRTDKPSVLVVDDDEPTVSLLRALLQSHFLVDIAYDGNEAIAKLRTKNYGAILLDLRMPLSDGFAVLEFLQSTRPESLRSVIVLTALLTKEEIARVWTYKVCAVMAKPFEIDGLVATVKTCSGIDEGPGFTNVFCAPAFLLLADLLRQKLM